MRKRTSKTPEAAAADDAEPAKRKRGRPPKGDPAGVPYAQVDRLLVYGEQTVAPDGMILVRYPSYRELARRFDVDHTVITRFAQRNKCLSRRQAVAAEQAEYEEKRRQRDAEMAREAAAEIAAWGGAGAPGIPAAAPLGPVVESAPPVVSPEIPPEAPVTGRELSRRAGSRSVLVNSDDTSSFVPMTTTKASRIPLPIRLEMDRLLVCGEEVMGRDGVTPTVYYPTHREIGSRVGVNQATVTEYAQRHNCKRRREEVKAQLAKKVEARLLEIRGERIALTIDDILSGIDEYLRQFREAVLRREVRTDNPADFDRLTRLRLHLTGGPDQRVEVNGTFTLEAVQLRHAELLQQFRDADVAEAGVTDAELVDIGTTGLLEAGNPPAPADTAETPKSVDRPKG
jgi:hypothetical protein